MSLIELHRQKIERLEADYERTGKLNEGVILELLTSIVRVEGVEVAEARAERFVSHQPENPYHYYHLALLKAHRDEAVASEWFLDQIADKSKSPHWLYAAGLFLNDVGRYLEAMDYLERAAVQRVRISDLMNPFAFASLYAEDLDAQSYLVRLKKMTELQFGRAPVVSLHRPGKPRYVIGFVTASLSFHALIYFLEPLIKNLDRKKFMLLVFSSESKEGMFYAYLQSMVDVLYDVRNMNDSALLELIRSERVDVLVDLDHHTKNNRLWVFAQRAAPIQITMYGLHTTTAVAAMDYRVTDIRVDPPGADSDYSEILLRTRRSHFSHHLLVPGVSFTRAPVERNGFITFGSFNSWKKVNRRVVKAWANLLHQFSDSRLIVVGFDSTLAQARCSRWLKEARVDMSRVDFHERLGLRQLHETVQSVDIALDTWPYGGGVTTAMILELGVPVATILGSKAASRMGASMLADVQTPELIAHSPEAFAEVVAKVLIKPGELQRLRDRVIENYSQTIGNGASCAEAVAEVLLHAIAHARDGNNPTAFI